MNASQDDSADVDTAGACVGAYVPVEKGMLSRVLYPNPVCLLSVWDPAERRGNVMTITWLTPINNQGGFICSVNCNRHTASFVRTPGAIFVLNVPVRGMEDLVLAIGGCSGATVDKFAELQIPTCAPGGADTSLLDAPNTSDALGAQSEDAGGAGAPASAKKQKLSRQELARRTVANAVAKCVAVRGCAAHVVCLVETAQEDDGHWTLRCSQLAAWSLAEYWDGKNFIPRSASAAPFLTFLGSKTFGYVVPLERAGSS